MRTFFPDYYGRQPGPYKGRRTDRFLATWWPLSERVQDRLSGKVPQLRLADLAGVRHANRVEVSEGLTRLAEVQLGLDVERLLIEIPAELTMLREKRPEWAAAWQHEIGNALEDYLS